MNKLKIILPILLIGKTGSSQQDSTQKSKWFTLHAQETTVSQFRPKFKANYTGPHSQIPIEEWGTTITSTFFLGVKLWSNAQLVVNPEIAGGHGLSSAFGIAAFTNGEAFRVGNPDPTFYLARGYFRQFIPLSKEKEWQDEGENKLAQYIPKKYLALTIGKVSIADYFDDNTFSHNPRTQFLSWGLMSNGAWDYPANTRGYTPSIILEYISPKFEVRYAVSMMPNTANGNIMDKNVSKANANSFELKYKYKLNGQPGKISALAFYNTALMGSYTAPNIISRPDSANPNFMVNDYSIVASRQYGRSKYGFGLNVEQNINDQIGVFARASYNDGKNETWCFTEIDRAFSIGTSIKGSKWKRENDVFGLAYCISGLSDEHATYLANGGLGFIIGDGKLNYSNEHLWESYYSLSLCKGKITPSFVYQFVMNPAYNKDRGPINIYSIRLHLSI
ncbi:MAG: carbohydrate porin [Bacteroidetes bacterium]|nr:carbohydrate porin [Bacteroidota bacterium]